MLEEIKQEKEQAALKAEMAIKRRERRRERKKKSKPKDDKTDKDRSLPLHDGAKRLLGLNESISEKPSGLFIENTGLGV